MIAKIVATLALLVATATAQVKVSENIQKHSEDDRLNGFFPLVHVCLNFCFSTSQIT
jgi:hypothetical protein